MDYFKRASQKDLGCGGWKCQCCGPSPKERPRYRRMTRRRLKYQMRLLDVQGHWKRGDSK